MSIYFLLPLLFPLPFILVHPLVSLSQQFPIIPVSLRANASKGKLQLNPQFIIQIGNTRRGLDSRLERLFAMAEDLGYYAVIMIDADGLKDINDNYGHDKGDIYLRKIADTINAFDPQNSVAARQGGDISLHFYLSAPDGLFCHINYHAQDLVVFADLLQFHIALGLHRQLKYAFLTRYGIAPQLPDKFLEQPAVGRQLPGLLLLKHENPGNMFGKPNTFHLLIVLVHTYIHIGLTQYIGHLLAVCQQAIHHLIDITAQPGELLAALNIHAFLQITLGNSA